MAVPVRRISVLAVAASLWFGGLGSLETAGAAPVIDKLSFVPVADTYVSESSPDTSFGTASSLHVDATARKQSFLRFEVDGIEGRPVVDVKLRMFQKDLESDTGGRVFSLANNSWTESTTWSTRPSCCEGSALATFGPVSRGNWYEVGLGSAIASDGLVSFALDSPSANGAIWASRNSSTPPVLEVSVQTDDTTIVDGWSTVAPPTVGSSSPTYFATNHRMAVTENGRSLVVNGRHRTGVQLAWRDGWGSWRTSTTGGVSDGLLLGGTGTGDWPASIALARDSLGEQHAWIVWAGPGHNSNKPLQMRRLSDLDSPDGPRVGPIRTLSPAGTSGEAGNSKVDIAFETTPTGSTRGVIAWLKRTGASTWDLSYTWFTDLDTNQPIMTGSGVLFSTTTGGYHGTLVSTNGGVAWVGRTPKAALRVYNHSAGNGLTEWTPGATGGITINSTSYPSAVELASGEILTVVESSTTNHVVKAQLFSASGAPLTSSVFALTGYSQPTVVTDGTRAWMVMIRQSDGFVVSRTLNGGQWSASDRVELGAEAGGVYSWPNAVRDDANRLRVVLEGPASSASQSSVLAYQRPF